MPIIQSRILLVQNGGGAKTFYPVVVYLGPLVYSGADSYFPGPRYAQGPTALVFDLCTLGFGRDDAGRLEVSVFSD